MTAVNNVEKAVDLLAKVDPKVTAMSALVVADVKNKGKIEGSDIIPSAALYAELLPEGLTMDHVKALADHHSILYPALGLAHGELSTPLMAENKDLTKTTMELSVVGKDKIRVQFDRERSFPDQQTKGTITKMGQINIDHQTYGTKNRGEVTKVKSYLSALALEALGGK